MPFSAAIDSRHLKCMTDECHPKGKSLSLICGSLTWLRESKRRQFEGILNSNGSGEALSVFVGLLLSPSPDDGEPEWIVEHSRAERRRNALQARHDVETRLAKARERERKLKERDRNGEPAIKRRACEFSNNFKTSSSDDFRKPTVKTRPTSMAKNTLRLMIMRAMTIRVKGNNREMWVCQSRHRFC